MAGFGEEAIGADEDIAEDELDKFIREAIDAQDGEDDDIPDEGGFDLPHEDTVNVDEELVDPDKGRALLDDADLAKDKGENPSKDDKGKATEDADPKDPPKDDTSATPKDENGAAEDAKGEEDATPDLTSIAADKLLEGLSDTHKAEVTRRMSAADGVLGLFEGRQDQLKMHGVDEKAAMDRLLDLNDFAQQKPGEYVAWVSQQTGKEPQDVLNQAAGLLGYKLVKDEPEASGDDDLFEDEATKALRQENAALKAQIEGKAREFGPDTSERVQARNVQQELANFENERDEQGQLKRPMYRQMQPIITQKAIALRNQTGQPVTVAQLDQLYQDTVLETKRSLGVDVSEQAPPAGQAPSAANDAGNVTEQMKKKAEAAKRAQRASKSIDGTGQGATRRPALSDDASLDEVISHFAYGD